MLDAETQGRPDSVNMIGRPSRPLSENDELAPNSLPPHWYLAATVIHSSGSESPLVAREVWFLLTASDSEAAYHRALSLAAGIATTYSESGRGEWFPGGISELLAVWDPPSDGSEVMWTSQELTLVELAAAVPDVSKLRAFVDRHQPTAPIGWFICALVLAEVHETGTHGGSLLVWTNYYLIRADDAKVAFDRAMALGAEQAVTSDTHNCDGEKAHWEFKGLKELMQAVEAPKDGAILWVDESELTIEEVRRGLPRRENLSVFRWERMRDASRQ
jgi:hypothetical protein